MINKLKNCSTFISWRIVGLSSSEVLNDLNDGKIVRDYILISRRCGRTRGVKLSSIKAVGKYTDRDTVSFQAQVIEHVSSQHRASLGSNLPNAQFGAVFHGQRPHSDDFSNVFDLVCRKIRSQYAMPVSPVAIEHLAP